MPNYKLSYFWASVDQEGWSESFYYTASDPTAAQTELDNLMTYLKPLRSSNFSIIYARISDVAIRGDSLPTTRLLPEAGTYTIPTGFQVLMANSALLIELFVSSIIKNRWFLRGLAGDKIKGREVLTSTTWDTAFSSLKTHMLAGTYLARHRLTKGPPPTYEYLPIVNIFENQATARKPGRPFAIVRGRR
jgi:hypothetical protein